jgi:hypothetical protein
MVAKVARQRSLTRPRGAQGTSHLLIDASAPDALPMMEMHSALLLSEVEPVPSRDGMVSTGRCRSRSAKLRSRL